MFVTTGYILYSHIYFPLFFSFSWIENSTQELGDFWNWTSYVISLKDNSLKVVWWSVLLDPIWLGNYYGFNSDVFDSTLWANESRLLLTGIVICASIVRAETVHWRQMCAEQRAGQFLEPLTEGEGWTALWASQWPLHALIFVTF